MTRSVKILGLPYGDSIRSAFEWKNGAGGGTVMGGSFDSKEGAAGLMAVPKRKMSRSNTRSRRSQWKAELTELVQVRVGGREVAIPRRFAKAYKSGLVEVEG